MQDLNDKVLGGLLTAPEWNEVPSEIQNVIEALGLTLTSGDLNQLGKAIAGYVTNGTFYTDSGIANAYVLTKIGSKQTAPAYTDGFFISFLTGNTNTGASTINVAGLGVKNLKMVGGANVPAGFIVAGELNKAHFDGTDFILLNPLSRFTVHFDKLTQALSTPTLDIGYNFKIKSFLDSPLDDDGGEWVYDDTILKSQHDGSHTISATVPWNGLGGQDYQDFIDGVGETDPSGSGCIVRQFSGTGNHKLHPLFIEQFLTAFQGRGILDVEADGIVTEQDLVGTFAAGVIAVVVTTVGDFDKGGHITIKHDNNKYFSYHITSISGSTLSILPPLRFAATSTRCERTWFNKAHPGKFYMRQLAQRVANDTELNLSLPQSRQFFTQLDTNPNDEIDNLTAIAGGSISFFPTDNIGAVDIGSVPRFNIGRTAFIDVTNVGDGFKTFEFQTDGNTSVMLRMVIATNDTDLELNIKVKDNDPVPLNFFLAEFTIAAGSDLTIPQYYEFPMQLPGNSKSVRIEITASAIVAAAGIILDQIEVFPLNSPNTPVFEPDVKKILVAFGDSWVEGDLGSTLEREPLTFQLQDELPHVKIINEGVGGNTAGDLLIRFDADVPKHNPDYVLVNTGTNDAFNPPSGTFDPNAIGDFVLQMNQLISKIQSIGARPIIIGVPALAESDTASDPLFVNFLLNDRARQYAQFFYKRIGRLTASTSVGATSQSAGVPTGAIIERTINGLEICTRFADGSQLCTREIDLDTSVTGGTNISFLKPFLAGTTPSCSMSIQTITTGNTTTAMKDAFMRCADNVNWIPTFPTAGTATETFNLLAWGRWY